MGKASSSKKVTRAASTGGGRTARGRRPYGWYSALTVMVGLGVFLVAFSRHQQQAAATVHPRGNDHWHAAYGIDICGAFQPNLPQNPNLSTSPAPGIHTHGDGLMHVEPFTSGLSADAGNNATVARFAEDYPGFKLTSTEIQLPGQPAHKNGDKCDKKTAQVRIRVWAKASDSASITYSNPKAVHLKDGQAITIAFLAPGDDIPKPPAQNIAALKRPGETAPATASTLPVTPTTPGATAPGATTPTSAPAAKSPTTTAAGGPATTGAGGPATTAGAGTATTAAGGPPTTK